MSMTMIASSISTRPKFTQFASRCGTGQPHIMCPIEKYMSKRVMATDHARRRRSFGVSVSFSISSALAMALLCGFSSELPPRGCAPYPAADTAFAMAEGLASPSTDIELVSRETATESTPGTLCTAFSTLATHAAQLIPVTLYCSIVTLFPAGLPALMSIKNHQS